MRRATVLSLATRTVLAIAAGAVTALGAIGQGTAPAAPAGTVAVALAPAAATTSFGYSTPAAQFDVRDTTVGNDYNWRSYADTYLRGDTFSARQCGAFALWRIDKRLGLPTNTTLIRMARAYPMTGAKDMDTAAARAGYRVDRTPAVGALAQWEVGAWGTGIYGHVAYVARVYRDGTILIEEYNALHPLGYGTRKISARAVSHYLHIAHR